MIKFSQAAFEKAKNYLYTNGRVLDQRRYEYHFEGGSQAAVLEALAAFQKLEKPVVAKLVSPEVEHKTEIGAVKLGIADTAALHSALDELDAVPLDSERGYLIEETAPPGLEVIVGAIRDASFGPTVMVGLGGTAAEALADTQTRLAPLTIADAREMLDELRGAALLDGFRGSPRLDRSKLAETLVRIGDALCDHPSIRELEVNPLRVYPEGVLALDALLVLGEAEEAGKG